MLVAPLTLSDSVCKRVIPPITPAKKEIIYQIALFTLALAYQNIMPKVFCYVAQYELPEIIKNILEVYNLIALSVILALGKELIFR